MKTLLLVESDRTTRDELAHGLSGMTDELLVLTACDGEEAARALASCPVDILATELVMPVMDGFELLSYVLEEHPDVEVLIMGETELGRASQALCAGGVFRFLSKPVAVGDLIEVVRNILARPAKGRLTGLSLPGFLQLLSSEGRTCSLRVKAAGHEGRLDMHNGQVINASCNGTEGKSALFEALSWESPEIEVEDPRASAARLIVEGLPSLLLEAAVQRDLGGAPTDSETQPTESSSAESPGRDGQPDGDSAGGEPAEADPPVGSFSTFAEVPLQVEVASVAKGLRAFMLLQGTLGAGIVEFETGRSLAYVCRGRKSYFARMATETARAIREGMHEIEDSGLRRSVRQMRLPGPKQFQLVRVVRTQPRLMLIFSGLSGRTDVDAAGELLADFEAALLDSSFAPAAPANGTD